MISGKSQKSSGTARTNASGVSTVKSKNTLKAGVAVETMSAPNPFCPDTKVLDLLKLKILFCQYLIVEAKFLGSDRGI